MGKNGFRMDEKSMNGKKIRIIYDDLGRSTPKIGVVLSQDPYYIVIKSDRGIVEAIPNARIIRFEVLLDE